MRKFLEYKNLFIVGLATRTSNTGGRAAVDLGKLWNRVQTTKTWGQITHRYDQSMAGVYTDYESDENGEYTAIAGVLVTALADIPAGMVAAPIPQGKYREFVAESSHPSAVADTWMGIWKLPRHELQRNFIADFDLYHGDKATIFVGVH